jgi:hypothetical protein
LILTWIYALEQFDRGGGQTSASFAMEDTNMEAKEWEGDFNPLSDPDEKRHLLSVLDSFR